MVEICSIGIIWQASESERSIYVQMRRKGMSQTMSRKYRDITEGVGQTSRMAALTRSPMVNRKQNVTMTSTSTSRTAMSSDEDDSQLIVSEYRYSVIAIQNLIKYNIYVDCYL